MQNSTVTVGVDQRQIEQNGGVGWAQYIPGTAHRMIISSQATQGCGKTHFGLTMPGPIAVINADDGLDTVADKFAKKGKVIVVRDFRINPVGTMSLEQWDRLFYSMRDSYLWAVSCGKFRSVLVDTGTAMWEAQRMEAFGKLAQVPPLKYAEVNGNFEAMIRYAQQFPVNVLFTHRMKQEYANDAAGRGNKTGAMIPTGYSGMGYCVQLEIQQIWHPELKCPALKVINKCRPNQDVVGQELYGPNCTFQGLGKLVYPHVDANNWTDGIVV